MAKKLSVEEQAPELSPLERWAADLIGAADVLDGLRSRFRSLPMMPDPLPGESPAKVAERVWRAVVKADLPTQPASSAWALRQTLARWRPQISLLEELLSRHFVKIAGEVLRASSNRPVILTADFVSGVGLFRPVEHLDSFFFGRITDLPANHPVHALLPVEEQLRVNGSNGHNGDRALVLQSAPPQFLLGLTDTTPIPDVFDLESALTLTRAWRARQIEIEEQAAQRKRTEEAKERQQEEDRLRILDPERRVRELEAKVKVLEAQVQQGQPQPGPTPAA